MRKLTRRQSAEFLTEAGYPTSIHLLNRLCGPAVNQGPPPAGRWGARDLYAPDQLLAWAERRAGIKEDNCAA